MTSPLASVDSLALRQRFDAIIAEVDAIDLQAQPPEHMTEAATRIADKCREAVDVIAQLGGSPTLSAVVKFTMAETNVTLGRALQRNELLDDAGQRCDEALAMLSRSTEGQEARLLELRGRYLKGGIFAARSNITAAMEQLRDVVAQLEPQVARLHQVRASGNQAEIFAIDLMDRHVHAEPMLDDARAMLTDLEPIVRAIGDVEGATAGEMTDTHFQQPTTRPSRAQQLRNLAGMGATGIGCFVLASFVGSDLLEIVLWMIGGFILLGCIGAIRAVIARRD